MSTLMSVVATFWSLRKTSSIDGHDADDLAEALVVRALRRASPCRREGRDEQHGVLQDERGLRREDGEQVELGALEEVLDLVVADVERADDLALREQRGAHDARELHRDDALALAEVVSASASETMTGRAVSITCRTMLSETPPRASVMLSLLHVARARGRAIFSPFVRADVVGLGRGG